MWCLLNSPIKLFQKKEANFFCKVPEGKYWGFMDHLISGTYSTGLPTCQCRRHIRAVGLTAGLERSLGGGQYGNLFQYSWESHRQRSLVNYSPKVCKELDTTETLNTYAHTSLLNSDNTVEKQPQTTHKWRGMAVNQYLVLW